MAEKCCYNINIYNIFLRGVVDTIATPPYYKTSLYFKTTI